MGLMWGSTEITLKSALRGAWHMGAYCTSIFLPPGWGITALQGEPLYMNPLLSSCGAGEMSRPLPVAWVRGRLALPEMDQ